MQLDCSVNVQSSTLAVMQDDPPQKDSCKALQDGEKALGGLLVGLQWLAALFIRHGSSKLAENFVKFLMQPFSKGFGKTSDAFHEAFCRVVPVALSTFAR